MTKKIINRPFCGKILPSEFWHNPVEKKVVECPNCGSNRTLKDGRRYAQTGVIQRYLCKDNCIRFSKN